MADEVSQETHDGISAAAAALSAANEAREAGDSEREMSERVNQARIMADLNAEQEQGLGQQREV